MAPRKWLFLGAVLAAPLASCSFPEVTYETTPEPSDAGPTCSAIEDCDGAECGDDARDGHGICVSECGNPPCEDACGEELVLDLETCVGRCTTCAEAMECASASARCTQLVGEP